VVGRASTTPGVIAARRDDAVASASRWMPETRKPPACAWHGPTAGGSRTAAPLCRRGGRARFVLGLRAPPGLQALARLPTRCPGRRLPPARPLGRSRSVLPQTTATQTSSYGYYRSDIATAFPGLANSDGAVGFTILDTTTLSNGLHMIVWTATDSAGVTSGLGSRFFRVSNSTAATALVAPPPSGVEAVRDEAPLDQSPVLGRRTWDAEAPWRGYEADDSGRVVVRGEELEALPAGSRLDAATGVFTWAPGVGFVGAYDLVFIRSRDGRPVVRREVRVVLEAKGSGHVGAQAVIDTPRDHAEVNQPFGIGGWAVDLDAPAGTGIDAVHVWAYPVDGSAPLFVGAASYGIARPDVAAVHGTRFGESGYGLVVNGLPPATYDLAVFAWSDVVGTFVPARVVRVTVR
jgi:hypothetical protein